MLQLKYTVAIILLLPFFNYGQKQQQLQTKFLQQAVFENAHVGFAVYEPATNKFLYQHQSNKYFIPASNTKIFTCYAAMKALADSVATLQYITDSTDCTVEFLGNPTFLHPAFTAQPALQFFKQLYNFTVIKSKFTTNPFGNGWAWNDYDAGYMPERSAIPIYGNNVWFKKINNKLEILPKFFTDSTIIYGNIQSGNIDIERNICSNQFAVISKNKKFTATEVPFKTSEELAVSLLEDTLQYTIFYTNAEATQQTNWQKLYTHATDSILKYMMYNSDNLFAEQTLLMIGKEKTGELNDEKAIDYILKNYLNQLPQKPKWIDGSGLSRYNLITPQDFVTVLAQMKKDFPWQRITNIFPNGNNGTLTGYYTKYPNNIYAKTGTLSNNVALSGFITTKKGKELIFSVLVNNHMSSATEIRKAIETFISQIIETY
jgi:D-alanyl-D-alanine carboxypeptidase/D-alanyl-D-alanine-endopeptidase (penicillin-binding protein 4)